MSDERKIWTFGEAYDKLRQDADLDEEDPDEQFVTFDEMVGYFNDGIDDAEAEIHKINEDYFLTYDFLPMVEGEDEYDLPSNIYGMKIRGLTYNNGSLVYPIKKYRNRDKFEKMELDALNPSSNQEYRYQLINRGPNSQKMLLIPAATETATLAPLSPVYTPVKRWYLRNANRIPVTGEWTNPELIPASDVDAGTDEIAVSPIFDYVDGDEVRLTPSSGGTLPSPLVEGTTYYVIVVDESTIQLATSRANALAGTPINLTTAGTEYFTLRVAATEAIIRATLIDIPEFTSFVLSWVKANCLFKDGDPRLMGEVAKLEQQRKQMVDTLTEKEPDNDDTVEMDLSHYEEMS